MARELPKQTLREIREELARRRLAEEAAERERKAAESQRRRDASEFRAAMGGVTPVAAPDRARLSRKDIVAPRTPDADIPRPAPRDFELSDGAADAGPDDATDFVRDGISADIARKLRAGNWPVQRQLDLHGMTRDDARDALAGFLDTALHEGLRCLRIIHGKGIGSANGASILKSLSRHWLTQAPAVLAYVQPRDSDGGAGAVLVLLRPPSGTLKPKPRH
jgi:DNA-nicking Smr family endonuclease